RALGLELRPVGRATLASRESIGLASCFRFIRRQMLNTRLYHKSWPVLLTHAAADGLAMLAAVALAVAAVVTGRWPYAAWMAGVWAAQALAFFGGLWVLEWAVRPLLEARGESAARVPLKTLLAIPLTQAVYCAAVVSAALMR